MHTLQSGAKEQASTCPWGSKFRISHRCKRVENWSLAGVLASGESTATILLKVLSRNCTYARLTNHSCPHHAGQYSAIDDPTTNIGHTLLARAQGLELNTKDHRFS